MKPVCLVIGAGAGIGGTVGARFAREGYTACVVRRTAEKLAPLVAEAMQVPFAVRDNHAIWAGRTLRDWTEELAVMVDTFRPLRLTRASLDIEDAGYPLSWNH